jgi:intracellular sulfur oxidation DsrE/DsrF family protein
LSNLALCVDVIRISIIAYFTGSNHHVMKGLFFLASLIFISFSVVAQQNLNPEISPYGQVSSVPGVSLKADPSMHYKIVIEINNSDTSTPAVSQPVELIARLVNLLALDGVAKNKREIAVIFHNAGSYCIQTDEAYSRKYGRTNPNKDALEKLAAAGVHFYVCGQSTVKRNINPAEIIPQVKIATSFLTSYTTFQLQGYSTLKF